VNPAQLPSSHRVKNWNWFILTAIILLAAFLRLYQLDQTPPGLHYDEAFNAMQARDVLRGSNRPVFFTGNFGEEPMQMYVEAVVFALAGESPFTARLSNVVLGLLLIPALYFCGRAFFPTQRPAALAAAFVGAMLYWAINFSRLGIETNSLPWVLTLSAGALVLANEKRNRRWGVFAGLFTGAVIYTYLASRLWPLAVALWFVYLVLLQLSWRAPSARQSFARACLNLKHWLVVGLVAVLIMAPLALFFLANPLALTGRAGQVLTPDQLGANLLRTAGMFFISGDADPRDNLPGRAALDPFLALLFLIGLVVSAARVKQPPYAFLLIWLVVMTLPSALTEFAPNLRRAIGALPAVALLCGIGANWIWQSSQTLRPTGVPLGEVKRWNLNLGFWNLNFGIWRFGASLLLLLGLAFSAWSSANAYFNEWAHDTGLFYSFDAGILTVAQELAARPANEQLCLSPDYHDHPTMLWALDGRAFSSFDGRRVAVLPGPAQPATCAIITHEDQTFSFTQFYPDAQHLATIYDLEHKPYAQIFHIPAGAIPNLRPQHPLDARVGDAIRVLGYDLARTGNDVAVDIYWRAASTPQDDYTVFIHLIGPPHPDTQSPVWSQDDAQPGHGTYPTSRWRPGQTVVDRYELRMPADAPTATFQVEFGMYLLATGARLPVWVNGQRVAADRILSVSIRN
jgi:Dolichyl-phosphate-mannose-protein mannosyltransferase